MFLLVTQPKIESINLKINHFTKRVFLHILKYLKLFRLDMTNQLHFYKPFLLIKKSRTDKYNELLKIESRLYLYKKGKKL